MQRRDFLAMTGLIAGTLSTHRALAGLTHTGTSLPGSPELARHPASVVDIVRHTLERIAKLDRQGPQLRSIIELNPDAHTIAEMLDAELLRGTLRRPLHGVTIVVKDNIATGDDMATSAGSLALDGVKAKRDAHVIRLLREAGAVIVGKANMSEWAGIRSARSTLGWSARGGLTRNPYALDRSASGSSSGSAVAVAASLSMMAIGTETSGSIVSPASINGVVGLKPTVGRVSRDGITQAFDTPGPIARIVIDVAILLGVIAGADPNYPATLDAPAPDDYLGALNTDALRGARIGVVRGCFTKDSHVDGQIDRALARLSALGAELIDPVKLPPMPYGRDQLAVVVYEFRRDLPKWIDAFAPHAPIRSLADLIAFNEAHRDREMPYFGQELLSLTCEDTTYRRALVECRRVTREDGLDRVLDEHRLDAIVAPTTRLAWPVDLVNGDAPPTHNEFAAPPAVAGYPHLTVPAGLVNGLPIGLSFVGRAWSEARLLAYGYAFEQATRWRQEPRFVASAN
jgi:amidase